MKRDTQSVRMKESIYLAVKLVREKLKLHAKHVTLKVIVHFTDSGLMVQ